MKRLEESLKEITFLNKNSMNRCKEIWDSKIKPVGSLGIMEEIILKLSGIFDYKLEDLKLKGCHIVVSADNGIVKEGVSIYPENYTKILSEATLNNISAIGIICKNLNIDLKVVDAGMEYDIKENYENFYKMKVMYGSRNFSKELAMTNEETVATIENGILFAEELENKYDIFSVGEIGRGSRTTSSAILYSLTKESIENIVGSTNKLSRQEFCKKKKIIFENCVKYNTFQLDILDMLASVGGLDIAFLVGFYIGAVKAKKLILIDGFISAVAAFVACKLNPLIKDYLFVTNMSDELGMKIILDELDLKPFMYMEMSSGEGLGAALVYPVINSALLIYKNMKPTEEIYSLFSNN